MTTRRAPDFDLDKALADAGFTPRVGDVPALLDRILGPGAPSPEAERALMRVGVPAGRAAAKHAATAAPAARARLTKLVGRLAASAGGEELGSFLIERLGDADARTRRAAAIAVGKVRPVGAESGLSTALAVERVANVHEALVEALGKVGGKNAVAAIEGAAQGPATGDTLVRARLMATRTELRANPSSIDGTRPAPKAIPVALRCRAGLESLLDDELDRDLAPRLLRGGPAGARTEVMLTGPIDRLFSARTMLAFAFVLPEQRLAGGSLATAIADALTSPAALTLFRHYTRGPIRYRLAWAAGGKRRAVVWDAAAEVARRHPELVNDPTESPWEAIVYEGPGVVRVELSPRLPDPRFTYRQGDVPAASHPTIAAALVRASGVRPDDVVWDPFVGSGTELCERALAGPYLKLFGSDRDAGALDVARANLEAAGAKAVELFNADATLFTPPVKPTLIVTNPPLGRRVHRAGDLATILDTFLAHAADVLAPGGRLVWMAPFPERSAKVAAKRGLTSVWTQAVDMGGFEAELQVLKREARAPAGAGWDEAPTRAATRPAREERGRPRPR